MLTLKLAYEKYGKDYHWFILTDDDTYIIIENLYKFIRSKNKTEAFTYGNNFKVFVPTGYHQGGAGTLFTPESIKRIYNKIITNECDYKDEHYGDLAIGHCSAKAGVKLGNSLDSKGRERFHAFGYTFNLYLYVFEPLLFQFQFDLI